MAYQQCWKTLSIGFLTALVLASGPGAASCDDQSDAAQITAEQDAQVMRAEADRLITAAINHNMTGRDEEAIQVYTQAIGILEQIGDELGVVTVLLQMITTESLHGNHLAAQQHAEEALTHLRETCNSDTEFTLDTLWVFSRALGIQPEELLGDLDDLKPFVPIMRPFLCQVSGIVVQLQLADSLLATRSCARAREALQEIHCTIASIETSVFGWLPGKMLGAPLGLALARFAYTCGSQPPSCPLPPRDELAAIDSRIETARSEGDQSGAARLLQEKTNLLHGRGDFSAAADALETSLEIVRELGDERFLAQTLDTIGTYFMLWNREQEVLLYLNEAVTIRRQLPPSPELAASLFRLGATHAKLGFNQLASARLKEALAIAEKVEARQTEDRIRHALAQLKDPGEPLFLSRDPFGTVEAMMLGAISASQAQEPGKTERLAEMTLELATDMGLVWHQAIAHVLLATVRPDQAQHHFDQALRVFRASGHLEMESATMALAGKLAVKEHRIAEGIDLYERAIDLYEKIQADLRVPGLLSGLIDQSGYQLYEVLIEILAEQGRAEAAFEYSERARARAFLNLVGNRRLTGPGRSGDPELLAKAEQLRRQLGELEQSTRTRLGSGPARQTELAQLAAKLEEAVLAVSLSDPEYADLVQIGTIDLKRLQAMLDNRTTLLVYFATASRHLAWVINQDGLKMVPLELSSAEIQQIVLKGSELRGAKLMQPAPEATLQQASVLYQRLIAPLVSHIPPGPGNGHRRLIIVPHGALHFLPFAALRNAEQERFLIDDYTLVYAPSASVLPHLLAKQTPNLGRALVLGDPEPNDTNMPRLPHARTEAETVAALLETTALLGTQATESALRSRAGAIDWLHVAAHAISDPVNPALSRVELAAGGEQDGHLEVHEVLEDLDLGGVNLVVLSACNTAQGELSRGDEIVGLTRALHYAGSPTVVTTLWPIDDAASAALMKVFYESIRAGQAPAEALRQAQLALKDDRWPSPYYWAAFKVTGDSSATTEPG